MPSVVRLGDTSDHGGVVISSAAETYVDGILVARVGDLHSCPIPGHGITPIINGSGNFYSENNITAVVGSVAGCGAVIITGSPNTFAPLEDPRNAMVLDSPTSLLDSGVPA
jgi:uncharacterized Zn-binding protein involved in type VI secretion